MREGLDDISVSAALARLVGAAIDAAGGWIPFSRFMAMALYAPGLGYYASGRPILGRMPASGSDFVTAPELSPLFARALARQVRQALDASGSDEVWEFGAGSGALAAGLLASSAIASAATPSSRSRRRCASASAQRPYAFADRVRWLDALPESLDGVVVGNEVLDAMPVELIHFDGASWLERGVARGDEGAGFAWGDRPGEKRPPVEVAFPPGSTTELHPQAEAFVATLADRLGRGAIFLVDYGFPEHEYYHPQRVERHADVPPRAPRRHRSARRHRPEGHHRAPRLHGARARRPVAGLDVVGYTSQARFLLDCGFAELLADATLARARRRDEARPRARDGRAVQGACVREGPLPPGFAADRLLRRGDRRHRL